MLVTLFDQSGKRLDAKVEVERGAVVLHSRGGAFGKPNLRNPDYKQALKTILLALRRSSLQPVRVVLDSGPAKAGRGKQPELLSAAELSWPVDRVVSEIGKRAAAWGRPQGATGHGNTTKRVKILVPAASQARLAAALVANARSNNDRLPLAAPPIIYFNVGWMRDYAGPKADDPTIGAHGYLHDHLHGAECYNFAVAPDGKVRGYRPPGDRNRTNISRLGASRGEKALDGVLVVWLAREPESGVALVVGWYLDATVYRDAREGSKVNREIHHYSAEAEAKNAVLLPVIARGFAVASSRTRPGEGFGQKPTWYGTEAVNKRVWDYVRSWPGAPGSRPRGGPKRPPKNYDPELRRKVERAAVEHAEAYYKAKFGSGCEVRSVEAFGRGWDLEVYHQEEPLLVEVKGLLNPGLVCELTPNEYAKMMLPGNRERYVVYVLNNALAEPPAAPVPSVFVHVSGNKWETEDGRELLITRKTGAVLSCK